MFRDNIAIIIKCANIEFEKQANSRLAQYGLTHTQYCVLKYMDANRDSDVRPVDIEKYYNLSNPTVTCVINKMVENGWISKVSNPNDKRSIVLKLTDKIDTLGKSLLEIGTDMENDFTRRLSPRENAQLKTLLKKMINFTA